MLFWAYLDMMSSRQGPKYRRRLDLHAGVHRMAVLQRADAFRAKQTVRCIHSDLLLINEIDPQTGIEIPCC